MNICALPSGGAVSHCNIARGSCPASSTCEAAISDIPELLIRLDPASPDPLHRQVYEGIRELPPGHTLTLQGNQLRVQPYWQLGYEGSAIRDPRDARGEDELVEELRALLIDATRIRLRADVPVGAYLSGGLDS